MCSSNWIIFPGIGVTLKNVWNHHQKGVETWGHIYPSLHDTTEITCAFVSQTKKRMVQNRSPSSMFFVTTRLENPNISSLSKHFQKKRSTSPSPQTETKFSNSHCTFPPPRQTSPKKKARRTRNPKRRKSIALCGIASTCWGEPSTKM